MLVRMRSVFFQHHLIDSCALLHSTLSYLAECKNNYDSCLNDFFGLKVLMPAPRRASVSSAKPNDKSVLLMIASNNDVPEFEN
jgi:hypothetical protein